MAKDVNEILNALPVERRKKIGARAKDLRAEYLTRQKARGLSEEELAQKLDLHD